MYKSARPKNGRRFVHTRPGRPERDKAVFELLRAMRGLRNCEIAKKTFVSPSTISNLRTRRTRYPQHLTMVAIAEAIGMQYTLTEKQDATVHRNAKKRLEYFTQAQA